MRDSKRHRALLGPRPPWSVVSVEGDVKSRQVTVTVDPGLGASRCPECQTEGPGYDQEPRCWRRLDMCQFTTWIVAELPRTQRPTHGIKQAGDTQLVGPKGLWPLRPQAMPPAQRATRRRLQRSDVKVARVWSLKERIRQFLGCASPGGGHAVLRPLVLACHPQPAQPPGQSGLMDSPAPRKHPHLPPPPHYQRRAGDCERRLPVGEEDPQGVPESRPLQDRDPLPLRRTRPLPIRKPAEPAP